MFSRGESTMRIAKLYGRLAALLVILPFFIAPGAIHAATTSGSLIGNEVWSGTVTLTGDIVVPSSVTLTIKPGTRVVFPAGSDDTSGGEDPARTELIVHGSLVAVGTAESGITFTSGTLTSPQRGDWGGIRLVMDEANGSVTISHATIEYATYGIAIRARTCTQR